MYRPDHPPAHFHAEYGEHWAKIDIETGEPIAGELPARALRFVREWVSCIKQSSKTIGIGLKHLNHLCRSILCPKNRLMIVRVTEVEPLEGHCIRLTFDDGLVRDVDMSFLLRGPLGEQLRDLDYFRQVRVDEESRTVVWPNGLDPDPDVLHGGFRLDQRAGGTRASSV